LFTAFAPADNPTIALAMIVENAGFGAANSAPIARRVFDYWLMHQYPNDEDIEAVQKAQAPAPIGKPRMVNDMPWPPDGDVPATIAPIPGVTVSAATAVRPASAPARPVSAAARPASNPASGAR
jgi:penicillin-binding protein 2